MWWCWRHLHRCHTIGWCRHIFCIGCVLVLAVPLHFRVLVALFIHWALHRIWSHNLADESPWSMAVDKIYDITFGCSLAEVDIVGQATKWSRSLFISDQALSIFCSHNVFYINPWWILFLFPPSHQYDILTWCQDLFVVISKQVYFWSPVYIQRVVI